MTTFGIAGVQMNIAAFQDNVDRMGGYMRHIRMRLPWVRRVMFSELAALGPRHEAVPRPGPRAGIDGAFGSGSGNRASAEALI